MPTWGRATCRRHASASNIQGGDQRFFRDAQRLDRPTADLTQAKTIARSVDSGDLSYAIIIAE